MKPKVLLKNHNGVIAICDSDIIGKTFEEGNLQLKISEYFYKGEEKSEKEIINMLKECLNANIVGKASIRIGLESGVISKEHVITVKGIPHAQKFVLL